MPQLLAATSEWAVQFAENRIDKRFNETLLYCVPHSTVASSGQDFQEGLPVLPVRKLSSHFQQLNAGDDA